MRLRNGRKATTTCNCRNPPPLGGVSTSRGVSLGQSHLDKYKIISSKMWSFFSEGVTSWTIHP